MPMPEANIQILPSDVREWTLAAEKARRVHPGFASATANLKNLSSVVNGEIQRRNYSVKHFYGIDLLLDRNTVDDVDAELAETSHE